MILASLLQDIPFQINVLGMHSNSDQILQLPISHISDDSRTVQPGGLFVAIPGQTVDGHRFVNQAAKRGAAVAVVQHLVAEAPKNLVQIQVVSTSQALGRMAAHFYNNPANKMTLCAVTGTNGKTTTTFLVEALLAHAGYAPGLLGTVLYRYAGYQQPSPFTTPGSLEIHRLLDQMAQHGTKAVVLEASSHALALDRLFGILFRVVAFTNLSQDHLDFHGDMEAYFQTKAALFREHLIPYEQGGRAVINADNAYGQRLLQELSPNLCIAVSSRPKTDAWQPQVSLHSLQQSLQGIRATFHTPKGLVSIHSPLCGQHNVENLAVAVGMGVALDLPAETIGTGLSTLQHVPGRLQRVPGPKDKPTVFVDYAHTPDALVKVLQTVRSLSAEATSKKSRIFVVFGCGGDRDRGKRVLMGQAASQYSDALLVTSDNPRTEDPIDIIQQIIPGIDKPLCTPSELLHAKTGYLVHPDRRQAIHMAVSTAKPQDVVVIAGKGHETHQIIGEEKLPFDDVQEAALALHMHTL